MKIISTVQYLFRNVGYMNAALDYLRETGLDVREEDLERLSPLVSHHINFVGKYLAT